MSYIKSLKLKTGELIACEFQSDIKITDLMDKRGSLIKLRNPIVYKNFQFLDPDTNQIVDTISMAPYNNMTDDKEVIIEITQIQSINSMRAAAQQRYIQFVSQLEQYNREGDRQLAALKEEDHEPEELVNTDSMLIWPIKHDIH